MEQDGILQLSTACRKYSDIHFISLSLDGLGVRVRRVAAPRGYPKVPLTQPSPTKGRGDRRVAPGEYVTVIDPEQLSRDEIVRRIERGARRRLHMSARELVEAYRTGRMEDPGAVADLLALASLLVETDPLFVPA